MCSLDHIRFCSYNCWGWRSGSDYVLLSYYSLMIYVWSKNTGFHPIIFGPFNVSDNYPRACARGIVIGCVVFVIVSTKIALSRDLGTWATRMHNESVKFGEKLVNFQCVSNQGTQSTSVILNSAFLLAIIATPIDSAHSMHNACAFFPRAILL